MLLWTCAVFSLARRLLLTRLSPLPRSSCNVRIVSHWGLLRPLRLDSVTKTAQRLEENRSDAAGHHLAQLPVDARVGKLLLLGASLECLAPVLTIAACLSYKSPFSAPFDQQDAAQRIKVALATAGGCLLQPLFMLCESKLAPA